MSFFIELKKEETLAEGIHRVLNEQTRAIHKELSSSSDLVTSVHNARKHFKIIRSLLRLLRIRNGNTWFSSENSFYRGLASQLSDIRDLHVLLDSIELLQNDATSLLTSFNTGDLYQFIHSDIKQSEKELILDHTFQVIKDELTNHSIPDTRLEEEATICTLIDGLEQVYEAGYNNMYQTYLNPNAENFHEWRKTVKHLLYSCQLLNPYWPITTSVNATNLKELSDVLGQEHDLANLQVYLRQPSLKSIIDVESIDLNIAEAEKKRTKLQRTAEHLGKEVYAETAEYFIRHFQNAWCSYKLGA